MTEIKTGHPTLNDIRKQSDVFLYLRNLNLFTECHAEMFQHLHIEVPKYFGMTVKNSIKNGI